MVPDERARPGPGIAALIIVTSVVLAIALNAGFTLWAISSNQAAQRQQGLAVERKICTTMGQLAALKPPPGNPKTNPSRAFDQNLHATLDRLGTDLGCP